MLEVTCAVIIQNKRLLIAQRKEGDRHALKWELPGGKLEPNESYEVCIRRELKEELDIEVNVISQLKESIHDYPKQTIKLIPLQCEILAGTPKMLIHNELKWIKEGELSSVDWVQGDVPIVEEIKSRNLLA